MKRLVILSLLLVLSACLPSQITLVPVDTLVAQTMAARPKTNTPTPLPSDTPIPSATVDLNTPTPEINLGAPGAYCLPVNTERTNVLVTRILDGETIEVSAGFETRRVRYIGLDAPGLSPTLEWRAPQAIAANETLVKGKYVTLVRDISDADAQGFMLRYVLVENTFVNYEIIRQGFAKAVTTLPDIACEASFMAAQAEAMAYASGIWVSTPVPTFTITPTPTITRTPTKTQLPPCTCRYDLSCNNFRTQKQAQACYDYCLDIGFGPVLEDKNNNGKVCEGLP